MRTQLLATTAALGVLLAAPALADTPTDPQRDAPLGQTTTPPAAEAPAAGVADAVDDAMNDAAGDEPAAVATPEPAPASTGILAQAAPDQMPADDLIGLAVLDAADENVGRVGGLLVNQAGTVDGVIVDMGGFLGFGAKTVAIGWDSVRFVPGESGRMQLAVVDLTAADLEAAPEFGSDEAPLVQ